MIETTMQDKRLTEEQEQDLRMLASLPSEIRREAIAYAMGLLRGGALEAQTA